MAALTYFVALRFDRQAEEEPLAGEAQECPSAKAAIYRAQRMAAVSAGAIAFSRTGDPTTGEFEAAVILRIFGEVPPDHLLRGYDEERAVSYFVTLPIGERSIGVEIRGYEQEADAFVFASELAARYPLVIVAEDFGEGKSMRLVKAFGAEVGEDWQPAEWINHFLSSYGGRWQKASQMKAQQKALSPEVERGLQFIGPRPQPKRFFLYVVDADQNVIETENVSCDTQAEAERLLADLECRFPGVVVVDANHGSAEGPYPLHVVGNVGWGRVYELLTYGCAFKDTFSAEDVAFLLEAIENPPDPSPGLIETFERYFRLMKPSPHEDDDL